MKGKRVTVKEKLQKLEKDAKERRKIFDDFLKHVRAGYSIDCFAPLSDTSVKAFLKRFPEEFVQEELDQAMRDGKQMWEGIGHRQALGSCMGNSRSWYYNMANRYGWREKLEVEAEHKGNVNVSIISYSSKNSPDNE